MNHSLLTGSVLAAGMAIAGIAVAEQAAEPADPPPMHRKLDRGPIDIAQANERAAKAFDSVDANTDGQITEDEMLAADMHGMFGPGKHRPWAGRHGGREAGEKVDRSAETFAGLDTDGNGQLSAEEFARLHEVRKAQFKKAAFTRMDKNADGTLSKDEFPPFVAHLKTLDTDNDGKVTREEMRAGRPHREEAPPPAEAPAEPSSENG